MDEDWDDAKLNCESSKDFPKLRCFSPNFEKEVFQDDGLETVSSVDQVETETSVRKCIQDLKSAIEIDPELPVLRRLLHLIFLKKGISELPTCLEVLDSSRPWLCYWILHSIELLDGCIPEEIKDRVIHFLGLCQSPEGGFGGGPGQEAHLAPTYAAVLALCILRKEEAYQIIDRRKLLDFLMKCRMPNGSFKMHEGSESDIRGTYCALSVAMLTSIMCQELIKGTAHYVSRCQTYEGGFGGVPGMEAHGGYTFCGLASLLLLREGKLINQHKLLRWLVHRQTRYEGGFQGRTNKLVDSCYSFWQGGCFPLIHRLLEKTDSENLNIGQWLFNEQALQEYLLISCQSPHGGFIDKPGKSKDFYHTCYALSGLSIAQHFQGTQPAKHVLGHANNELNQVHPLYNICVDSALDAIQYFQNKEFPGIQSYRYDVESDESS